MYNQAMNRNDELENGATELAALGRALRQAHQSLLEQVRRDWERTHGRVAGPAALLDLLLSEPYFAWLRPLSRIMAEIDDLLEARAAVDSIRIAGLRERLETVLTSEQYLDLLQRSPAVVMAHSGLRRALADLARR